MDEIINLVAQRTGIPADKAKVAVDTVLEQLRTRLPAPMASQLDSLLQGGGGAGGLGGLAQGLGGMFGGSK